MRMRRLTHDGSFSTGCYAPRRDRRACPRDAPDRAFREPCTAFGARGPWSTANLRRSSRWSTMHPVGRRTRTTQPTAKPGKNASASRPRTRRTSGDSRKSAHAPMHTRRPRRKARTISWVRGKPADELAFAFYGADTVDQSLAALPSSLAAADRVALGEIFAAFRTSLEPWLTESRSLGAAASSLSRSLDAREVRDRAARLGRFFGVDRSTPITFVFVHGTVSDHTSAHKRGPFVQLEANPTLVPEEASRDIAVPFHELVHHLAGQMTEERKRAFSTTFRAGCALPPRSSMASRKRPGTREACSTKRSRDARHACATGS
jgi:hypothetical protein